MRHIQAGVQANGRSVAGLGQGVALGVALFVLELVGQCIEKMQGRVLEVKLQGGVEHRLGVFKFALLQILGTGTHQGLGAAGFIRLGFLAKTVPKAGRAFARHRRTTRHRHGQQQHVELCDFCEFCS